MHETSTQLKAAFLEDHSVLTTGLVQIVEALRRKDIRAAVEYADRLDRAVGSHMHFEEAHLYPGLRNRLGSEFVDQLYREHASGLRCITTLVQLGPDGKLGSDRRKKMIEELDRMIEHAESCGSLLSHVENIEEEQQRELLDQLLDARSQRVRWTSHTRRTRGTEVE